MRLQLNKAYQLTESQLGDDYSFILAYHCENCDTEMFGAWKNNDEQVQLDVADTYSLNICPVCGNPLSKESGYFAHAGTHQSRRSYLRVIRDTNESLYSCYDNDDFFFWGIHKVSSVFESMYTLREPKETKRRSEIVDKKIGEIKKMYDNPCISPLSTETRNSILSSSEKLGEYLKNLIKLETDIYSVTNRLECLFGLSFDNEKQILQCEMAPIAKTRIELQAKEARYRDCHSALEKARSQSIPKYTKKPPKPPVLETPSFFNKKKVLAKNEELTATYQAELQEYEKQKEQHQQKQIALHNESVKEAEHNLEAVTAELEHLRASHSIQTSSRREQSSPVKAVKAMLDKETALAVKALKDLYACRNQLYGYDIVFGKYRNAIALSSFYEYLAAGRCSTLDGANGAYNLFESEVRANRIISQLDTVISSLEEMKHNQYMMYAELCAINDSLDQLNYTMDKALTSIQSIEANSMQINEYMERIADNSDVIAHNTAVSAYYSKVNAELTNALGYMVAFK